MHTTNPIYVCVISLGRTFLKQACVIVGLRTRKPWRDYGRGECFGSVNKKVHALRRRSQLIYLKHFCTNVTVLNIP